MNIAPSYEALLAENAELKRQLQKLQLVHTGVDHAPKEAHIDPASGSASSQFTPFHALNANQIARYGRQLILSEVGVDVQSRLCAARVLVVGAGGLGAPVCLYLAAAGVGRIGIVDPDTVEIDNLHRQVIHSEQTLHMSKAVSARDACLRLNSSIECVAYVQRFAVDNAIQLAQQYDILVDASDNVPTRYLVNDVGVLCRKPVVSGSALRLEGQVTVYGYSGGPCYRCMYPVPPPPATVANCGDAGVLGAVTGVIGSLQALEVIKIAGKMDCDVLSRKMVHFDAQSNRFMTIKLRARNEKCAICGDSPTITSLQSYEEFCGMSAHDKPMVDDTSGASVATVPSGIEDKQTTDSAELKPAVQPPAFMNLPDVASISAREFARRRQLGECCLVLDVREPVQYRICSLPGAINVPLRQLKTRLHEVMSWRRGGVPVASATGPSLATGADPCASLSATLQPPIAHGDSAACAPNELQLADAALLPVFVMCRRGIDSVRAVKLIQEHLSQTELSPGSDSGIFNVAGGLWSWKRYVDPSFPQY